MRFELVRLFLPCFPSSLYTLVFTVNILKRISELLEVHSLVEARTDSPDNVLFTPSLIQQSSILAEILLGEQF